MAAVRFRKPEVVLSQLLIEIIILSKFARQIDFHFLKRMQSLTVDMELALGFYGRHLEKSIWRDNTAGDRLFKTNLAG